MLQLARADPDVFSFGLGARQGQHRIWRYGRHLFCVRCTAACMDGPRGAPKKLKERCDGKRLDAAAKHRRKMFFQGTPVGMPLAGEGVAHPALPIEGWWVTPEGRRAVLRGLPKHEAAPKEAVEAIKNLYDRIDEADASSSD